MENMKCSRCGSDKIMPNLRIYDLGNEIGTLRTDWIGIEVVGKPKALVFKESHQELVRATVCGDCGNVEFTVDNPKGLWETYTKSQSQR